MPAGDCRPCQEIAQDRATAGILLVAAALYLARAAVTKWRWQAAQRFVVLEAEFTAAAAADAA